MKALICSYHFIHRIFIACKYYTKFATTVLHSLYKRRNRFMTVITASVILNKRICLVNEQHSAHSTFDDLCGLYRCLTNVACNKSSAVCFNDLGSGQKSIFI